MYAFLANYQMNESRLIIMDEFGEQIAVRHVHLPLERLVASLTSEMIDLSHHYNLYHEDIAAIGFAVNLDSIPYSTTDKLIEELEEAFHFKAIVDEELESTKQAVLAYMQEENR
ncbi:hypothetical protein [Gracilibacillus phocaeensis]|uniref:hypothetical protein n=1 Tax=Gracilibacillus phocaeensis TaxID=2042304 RepID=UPI00103147AC|nr:hypothetical protein [Gracilibacillus phocaeensis]